MDRHILAVLVLNKTGVLNKITGLYARRGFNIESLSVGTTEKPGVSRITITLKGDEHTVNQITSQLEKLVDVLSVKELSPESTVGASFALSSSPPQETTGRSFWSFRKSSAPQSSTRGAARSRS